MDSNMDVIESVCVIYSLLPASNWCLLLSLRFSSNFGVLFFVCVYYFCTTC